MISIIVPVYKAEKYLDKCVESILDQSFSDFELILVDDGSPDNCPAMCDEWAGKDKRIRVIHQKNQGASAARNTGLDHARGDYVMFCDCDDMVSPDWIHHLYHYVSSECLSICAYCSQAEQLGKDQSLMVESKKKYAVTEYFSFWQSGIAGYLCNALFNRRIIEENHLRLRSNREEGDYNEDLLFNLQYVRYMKELVYVGYADYLYDTREGSLSRSLDQFYFKKYEEKFRLWYNYLNDVQTVGWQDKLSSAMLYHYFISLQMAFDARDKKKFKEIIRSETVQFCLQTAESSNENERLIQMAKKKRTHLLWFIYQLQAWKRRIKNENDRYDPRAGRFYSF